MKFRYLFFIAAFGALFIKPPDRFSTSSIAYDLEGDFPEFVCPVLYTITARPLTYLGQGLQSVVFASEDGNYVMKFFFVRRPRTEWRWSIPSPKGLWLPYAEKKRKLFAGKNQRRTRKAIDSYSVAYNLFKEETGLVAVHLGKTNLGLPESILIDERGNEHRIDLDRASFIVQKRCSQERLEPIAVECLLRKKAERGFTDRHPGFKKENYGILDGEAIMLDPGNIVYSEAVLNDPEPEFIKTKGWFRQWQER